MIFLISTGILHPSSFANLALNPKKKDLVLALAEAHLGKTSDHSFDNFVVGTGQGLIIFLQ